MGPHPKYYEPIHVWMNTRIEPNGCAVWLGPYFDRGYGCVSWRRPLNGVNRPGGAWPTHRWMWTYLNGEIPKGMVVRHLCNNPKCINPDHLALGTQKDNIADMIRAGRHRSQVKTHCKRGHPFDEENTERFKNCGRQCRTCRIEGLRLGSRKKIAAA